MNLRKPTLLDLLAVTTAARADERAEYEAMRGRPWDAQRIAADFYSRPDVVSVCLYDAADEPQAVAGFYLHEHGVWRAWMFGTDAGWATHWRSFTKAIRRVMGELLDSGQARVVELLTTTDREAAMRWYVDGLGLQREGVLRARCANGQDVAVFSKIAGGAE